MKTLATSPEGIESTYALIVRSEERERSLIEAAVYTLLVISSLFALSQFGREAVTMPAHIVRSPSTMSAPAQHGA